MLKSKDETTEKFILYKEEAEKQLTEKIKVIWSDRGGEYVQPFGEFYTKYGIIHEVTPSYSPQSNWVAERKIAYVREWWVQCLLVLYCHRTCRVKLFFRLIIF